MTGQGDIEKTVERLPLQDDPALLGDCHADRGEVKLQGYHGLAPHGFLCLLVYHFTCVPFLHPQLVTKRACSRFGDRPFFPPHLRLYFQ